MNFVEIQSYSDSKWHQLFIDENDIRSYPSYPACPACGTDQENVPAVCLGRPEWRARVIVGVCPSCSHIYYRNPPSDSFIDDFYKVQWIAKRGKERQHPVKIAAGRTMKAAHIVRDLGLADETLAFLDLGCGTGGAIQGIVDAGFVNVFGCEQSDHRHTCANRRFPGRIFQGGYQAVPKDLSFDIIYSNHVFEHLRDPNDACSLLFKNLTSSGVFIINVPDSRAETAIGQALYLPHLHSFSIRSLHALGHKHGYQMMLWNGHRVDEICAVFYRDEESITNRKAGRFVAAAPDMDSMPDTNRLRHRLQAPWLLGCSDGKAVHVAWSPIRYSSTNEVIERYFSKITSLKKMVLDALAFLSHIIQKTNMRYFTYFVTRGLRLISTSEYIFKSTDYISYKRYGAPDDGRQTENGIPIIGVAKHHAAFFVK